MNKRQYSALAVVILIGLLTAAKVIHDLAVVEQTRREARQKARDEQRAKMIDKAIGKIVERKVEDIADVQACIDKGGVPIKTLFTGRLKRCDFPGKK